MKELELVDVPRSLQGTGIALITAGIMALSFMGFAGLISSARRRPSGRTGDGKDGQDGKGERR